MRLVFLALTAWLAATATASAHASDGGHLLMLPTRHYMLAAGLSVAASFLVLLLFPNRQTRPEHLEKATGQDGFSLVSALSFLCFGLLVLAGYIGSRDPLSNPLPLAIWTLLWVGVTLVQGLIGNVWRIVTPWRFPYWLMTLLRKNAPLTLPERLGCAPALVQFAGFAWFELIDPAPTDPARLANAVTVYFCINLIAALLFGYRDWMNRGEFLSVFYRILAGNALFRRNGAKNPLSTSETIFLICVLASVSFDGFSKTFFWLGHVGINPLDYPGRSAMMIINTVGLAGFATAMISLFYASIGVGYRLARVKRGFSQVAGAVATSLIPIALVYHFSHYATALLIDGQYALKALSDPFALGWNLLGLRDFSVKAGLASGHGPVWIVWNLQAIAITLGHMIAVYRAHRTVGALYPRRAQRFRFELPLTVMMIFYTVFGLWLLATPAAG